MILIVKWSFCRVNIARSMEMPSPFLRKAGLKPCPTELVGYFSVAEGFNPPFLASPTELVRCCCCVAYYWAGLKPCPTELVGCFSVAEGFNPPFLASPT